MTDLVWMSTTSAEAWKNVWFPLLSGLGALLVWHYGLHPLIVWVWSAPEDEHLETLALIEKLEHERDEARSALSGVLLNANHDD